MDAEEALNHERGVMLPQEAGHGRHIYNQFVIRCGKAQRDALKTHLKQQNIGTAIYYPVPMHLPECFADLGYQADNFPSSEYAAAQTLALPIYTELTDAMQASVVNAIGDFYAGEKE